MSEHADAWDPEQYHRFRKERSQPFHDLLAMVGPRPGGRAVDLGCGTGELTAELHRRTGVATTTGIDNSPTMLDRARAGAADGAPGLRFEPGDIAAFCDRGLDIVFSNAALQWVGDHRAVLPRWADALAPAGQLAVQVPANLDHPSHLIAAEVAAEEPFRSAFGGEPPPDVVRSVLAPEDYAELLYELGFAEQHVRLQVYGHVLPDTAAVVEWVKGTTLNRFRTALPGGRFDAFVARYRERLLDAIGDRAPYFYAFKRVLLWGRRP